MPRENHRSFRSVGADLKIPGQRNRELRWMRRCRMRPTLGVTVTVAAGDNGSTDGAGDGAAACGLSRRRVPTRSPAVALRYKRAARTITSEGVWNETTNNEGATGGGVSIEFALPSYQASAGVPANPETKFVGRGVPDVSGDADPSTGYQVVVDGQNIVVGGTSAVAPLWAGLVALLNQQLGTPVGMLQPKLYSLGEAVFRDITSGNNDDSKLGFLQRRNRVGIRVQGWVRPMERPCSTR